MTAYFHIKVRLTTDYPRTDWIPENRLPASGWEIVDANEPDALVEVEDWMGALKPPLSTSPVGTIYWPREHEYDLPNPFVLWPNWKSSGKTSVQCYCRPDEASKYLLWTFREMVIGIWNATGIYHPTEKQLALRHYLGHHDQNCGSPEAFRELARRQLLDIVPLIPDELIVNFEQGTIPPVPDSLKGAFRLWLEEVAEHSPPPTFTMLWGIEKVQEICAALQDADIRYNTDGKGKRRILAALHAAADLYRHPKQLSHWPVLLSEFIPNSKWSHKIKPHHKETWDEVYREAYYAILNRLQK